MHSCTHALMQKAALFSPHPTPHTPHPLLITENALVCVLPIWWVQ